MRVKILLLFLLLASLANWCEAKDIYLETSVCTISRGEADTIPERASLVITRKDIQNMTATNVADVLEQTGLVNIQQRGAFGLQGDISLRGATFDQYLIMVNGFPINDPQTGHHNLDLPMPLDAIDRIEITGGQVSSLYGSYGQGGVINIITEPDYERSYRASLSAGQNHLAGAEFSASLPTKILAQNFSLQHLSSSGWRDDTDFRDDILNYQLKLTHPYGDTSFSAGYVAKDFGAYKFYSEAFPDEFEKTRTFLATSRTRLCWPCQELQPQVSFREHHDYFILDRERPDFFFNDHTNTTIAFGLPYTLHLSGHTAIIGTDIKQDAIDSTNLGQHHRNLYSVYTEYLPGLPKLWKLQLGLRDDFYDNYSGHGIVSPSLNLNYILTPGFTYLAGLGRSFRVPTFTELYYADPSSRGDAALQAEKGWNYETGIKYKQTAWGWQNTVFWRDIRNAIDWVRTDPSGVFQAKNITIINSYGWESIMNYKSLATITYQYLNSAIDSSGQESKYCSTYLKHQVSGRIGCDLPYRIRPDLVITYRKPNQLKQYWVLDLKVVKEIGARWSAYIEGNNLLNTYYEESSGVPRPGRWLMAGLDWQV